MPLDKVDGTKARSVAFVCAAEILGLAGFSLVPALLPQFIATGRPIGRGGKGFVACVATVPA